MVHSFFQNAILIRFVIINKAYAVSSGPQCSLHNWVIAQVGAYARLTFALVCISSIANWHCSLPSSSRIQVLHEANGLIRQNSHEALDYRLGHISKPFQRSDHRFKSRGRARQGSWTSRGRKRYREKGYSTIVQVDILESRPSVGVEFLGEASTPDTNCCPDGLVRESDYNSNIRVLNSKAKIKSIDGIVCEAFTRRSRWNSWRYTI